jgi:O-antigen/teichoic acid export membrane protein
MQSKIRALASDTLVYGVSTVLGRFLTFLLTPLYTNYLSKEEIGDVTALYAMIAFVNIVYSLGMEPAFMRFWERSDDAQNRRVYGVAVATVLAIGCVVTALTVLAAAPIADSPLLQLGANGAWLVMLASLIPLLDAIVLIPFARLRMQQRPRTFAILRLVSIVMTVALNVVFVVIMRWRIEGVILAGILGSATTLVFFLPHYQGVVGTLRREWDACRMLLRDMLRFGLPTVPSNFSSIMVQVADRPIMMLLMGSAAVGVYQTNFRLAIPMMMFVTVFEYAWKPFYLHHRDDAEAPALFARVLTLFTVVCGAIFLITSLAMPHIVALPFVGGRFVNEAYWSGLSIVPIVLFAYYFNGVFINMAAGFHITKKTSWFPLATGVAAAISVGATFLFVPLFGMEGAAWAKVASYVASASILYVAQKRIYPICYDLRRVVTTVLATAVVYVGVMMIPADHAWRIPAELLALPVYVGTLAATGVVGTSMMQTLFSLVRR